MKPYKLFFLLALFFTSQGYSRNTKLKSGIWYTSFQLSEQDHLPVLLELKKEKKVFLLNIINGSERILLDKMEQKGDSVFLDFPAFASELRAKIHHKKYITGRWYNHAKKGNYYLPFWSRYQYADKYPNTASEIDVEGRWEVTFDYDKEPEKAIGLFHKDVIKSFSGELLDNRVTGTFMTETGDYRFLEGATIKDSLYLSAFDGSHAFLFKAQLREDTLWGKFLSGKHFACNWFALKNDAFELHHPDSLTFVTNDQPISFILPDLNGEEYNFPGDAETNKVTLIQIMGTWCPNCLDESLYLKQLCKTHGENLQIISVTFETQEKLADKINKVKAYRDNLELPFKFLIGGDACKKCATDLFPMLNNIISFPTLVFIDKKGEIRKIHTGFNGPGTGQYYEQFVNETNQFVSELIGE
ncbi:MAG: TlpA family protein disulfide reductase [Crocinitomicaceae bacterium]|nr:TlpA family protein disulfide reductase [Crocinitomicaceae bacterium]